MSLLGFQTALGRSVRGLPGEDRFRTVPDAASALDLSPVECARLGQLVTSSGFQFTVAVQRSWCESRAATIARQTLSVLSAEERRRALAEWVGQGGGTSSFVVSEAEAFLEFIAGRLPDPSHTLTLCRLEQATYRASAQAATFARPHHAALGSPDTLLCAARHAALVPFFVEPDDLFAALQRAESVPRLAKPKCHLLFAPGIPGLFRRASKKEVELWSRLAQPVQVRELSDTKHLRTLIGPLIAAGVISAESKRP